MSTAAQTTATPQMGLDALLEGFAPDNPTCVPTLVRYDFMPMEGSELPVVAGQRVFTMYKVGGWLFVRTPDGRRGYVPCKFCQLDKDRYMAHLQPSPNALPASKPPESMSEASDTSTIDGDATKKWKSQTCLLSMESSGNTGNGGRDDAVSPDSKAPSLTSEDDGISMGMSSECSSLFEHSPSATKSAVQKPMLLRFGPIRGVRLGRNKRPEAVQTLLKPLKSTGTSLTVPSRSPSTQSSYCVQQLSPGALNDRVNDYVNYSGKEQCPLAPQRPASATVDVANSVPKPTQPSLPRRPSPSPNGKIIGLFATSPANSSDISQDKTNSTGHNAKPTTLGNSLKPADTQLKVMPAHFSPAGSLTSSSCTRDNIPPTALPTNVLASKILALSKSKQQRNKLAISDIPPLSPPQSTLKQEADLVEIRQLQKAAGGKHPRKIRSRSAERVEYTRKWVERVDQQHSVLAPIPVRGRAGKRDSTTLTAQATSIVPFKEDAFQSQVPVERRRKSVDLDSVGLESQSDNTLTTSSSPVLDITAAGETLLRSHQLNPAGRHVSNEDDSTTDTERTANASTVETNQHDANDRDDLLSPFPFDCSTAPSIKTTTITTSTTSTTTMPVKSAPCTPDKKLKNATAAIKVRKTVRFAATTVSVDESNVDSDSTLSTPRQRVLQHQIQQQQTPSAMTVAGGGYFMVDPLKFSRLQTQV